MDCELVRRAFCGVKVDTTFVSNPEPEITTNGQKMYLTETFGTRYFWARVWRQGHRDGSWVFGHFSRFTW